MIMDSYTCELCILQKRETVAHLFLKCNFAKACWSSIGVIFATTREPLHILNLIRRKLNVSFFMEIIVIMTWSIWTIRNDWTFNCKAPTVQEVKRRFVVELRTISLHRAKPSMAPAMLNWIDSFK
uniref:Reverse transcriptase zinc-binding domain-containing protein n=1 Tax=Setaria viridis TaxID=4556 RepID=A0A4U6V129_SETVI|nr:hypothetical protein SEVIR_4G248600v2 [Setaria viridis]